MNLTLILQKHSRQIQLILVNQRKRYEKEADSGEGLVRALDKLLKNAKIGLLSLEGVKVVYTESSSLTSVRLAKTFQQALTIAKFYQPRNVS